MPYEGEVTTAVNIGAIPFKVTQVEKNAEVADRTLNFTLVFKKGDVKTKKLEMRRQHPEEKKRWQTRSLNFLGIAADKYDFKDQCGETKHGLTATLKTIPIQLKGGPLALVANKLQPLTEISDVKIECDQQMFTKPDEEVTVVVTYGVGPWINEASKNHLPEE